MNLSKEDIQTIAQELSKIQIKSPNERAGAKNREGVKVKKIKSAGVSCKPTIAAVVKSLAVVGLFAFWGVVFVGLCHYLAPYI